MHKPLIKLTVYAFFLFLPILRLFLSFIHYIH